MDGIDWERLQDLFLEAVEHDGEARARFVEQACGENLELRAELEAMLRAHERPHAGLLRDEEPEGPPFGGRESPPLRRIGAYRILELIGEGGMGRVYLAERDDDHYRQRVALKVMRPDFGAGFLRDRFRQERQILARLQHAHIATLLDGGVTQDGLPYLVMQYEPGIPVTTYCDEHALPLRRRLELFLPICEAVQFAHASLVVHRDLKPSNILVSEDGKPKLLDFGIAKILEESSDITQALTGDVRLLTPEHAAPEQIRGEPVTTAVDVYALGILLYELLTGDRPFRATGTTRVLLHQRICEEDPRRPSEFVKSSVLSHEDPLVRTGVAESMRTRPAALVQTLRGDLDQIVLKALRKEPSRRYESVAALAEDVRRYLDGRPVLARPDTVRYRMGKFVRRHALGVATAAAFVLTLGGFSVAMTLQQRETAVQRDRAELELTRAETVTEFLADLFRASRPQESLGETLTARDLLERGVARIDSLEGEPEVQNQMLSLLGGIYQSLGEYDQAEPLLERALQRRRDELREPDTRLALALHALSGLRDEQARYEEAIALAEEALAQVRARPGAEPGLEGAILRRLATVTGVSGDYEAAERAFRDLLELQEATLPANDPQLATTLHNFGRLLDRSGKYPEGEALFRRALAIDSVVYGPDHPDIAVALNSLGMSLYRQRRFQAAADLLEDVVEMRRRFLGPDHPGLATSLTTYALALDGIGDADGAIAALDQARDIYVTAQGAEHPNVASVLYNSARLLEGRNRNEEAEPRYREALRIRRATLGADHPRTALVETYYGRFLGNAGRLREAEGLLLNAIATNEGMGEGNAFTHFSRTFLADVYEAMGRPDEAARQRELAGPPPS